MEGARAALHKFNLTLPPLLVCVCVDGWGGGWETIKCAMRDGLVTEVPPVSQCSPRGCVAPGQETTLRPNGTPCAYFLLFSKPFSGADLLCHKLDRHPNISCRGEAFGNTRSAAMVRRSAGVAQDMQQSRPGHFMKELAARCDKRICGVVVMPFQLQSNLLPQLFAPGCSVRSVLVERTNVSAEFEDFQRQSLKTTRAGSTWSRMSAERFTSLHEQWFEQLGGLVASQQQPTLKWSTEELQEGGALASSAAGPPAERATTRTTEQGSALFMRSMTRLLLAGQTLLDDPHAQIIVRPTAVTTTSRPVAARPRSSSSSSGGGGGGGGGGSGSFSQVHGRLGSLSRSVPASTASAMSSRKDHPRTATTAASTDSQASFATAASPAAAAAIAATAAASTASASAAPSKGKLGRSSQADEPSTPSKQASSSKQASNSAASAADAKIAASHHTLRERRRRMVVYTGSVASQPYVQRSPSPGRPPY